jgi:hypothetical protein
VEDAVPLLLAMNEEAMIISFTLDRKIIVCHHGKPGMMFLSFFRPPTQRILMIYVFPCRQCNPWVAPIPCKVILNWRRLLLIGKI